MVAGMTPCTVAEPFCTAILRAGYHVELAGGGHHSEAVLRAKIDAIIAKVGAGCSITLNSLFLNPRLWAFQYPLVKAMRAEGYPIDGLTVAAGVPSFENGCEIVESLREAGLRHVAFKPGSVESIHEVIRIARACPRMPVVIQWTGGRGGGHHSFEDFHQPILETYSAIRAVPSLYLVAGSGFGDGPGSLPYLTGEWSLAYRVSPMPFDGLLLGSRVMVAAESMASGPVKELIVRAEGTKAEGDWVRSYREPVGGVVTVRSELGEPIHKIATRGVLLWKELDETLFQLPKERRLPAVLKKKAYLIGRFNADHQKVWFGRKLATGTPCDLAEMTYYEVCTRLGELCYVAHQGRWIDATYRRLLHLFMARIEERFAPPDAVSALGGEERSGGGAADDSPSGRIEPFFAAYPAARERLLSPEDVQAFLALCAIPWHKPVPFIPTLEDDKLEYWFKKDSLWQAEDLDAVAGQDPGRVCILHGPVAAGYSTRADQPVKEILDEINDYHVQALRASGVPVRHDVWFGGQPPAYPADIAKALAVEVIQAGGQPVSQFQLPAEEAALPSPCQWLEVLSGPGKSWLRALLRSQHVIQGPKDVVANRVRHLLRPRPRQLAEVDYLPDGRTPNSLRILEDGRERVLVTYEPGLRRIRLTISYDRGEGAPIPLLLLFRFNPADPYGLVEEEMAERNERIRRFYWRLWYGPGRDAEYAETRAFDLLHGAFECAAVVDAERVKSFCRIVGNHAEAYLDGSVAPMDYGMVACWEAVVRALFVDAIDGDLLSLVHLWNEIEYASPGALLTAGALLTTRAKVMGVTVGQAGKTVKVQAEAFDADGLAVLRVTTAFLFRGRFPPDALQFERVREDTFVLEFGGHGDLAIFREKAWVQMPQAPKIGDVLYLQDLVSFQQRRPDGSMDVEVTGSVAVQGAGLRFQEVGRVAFSGKALAGNPVTSYLRRAGRAVKEEHLFEEPPSAVGLKEGLAITTSTSNGVYSACSGDHNPIHTCPLVAEYVGLPGTITHGLWTSAAVRALVETYAGENRALAVTKFRADFLDMVLPGSTLQTRLRHIGMQNGVKLYSVETRCGERLVLAGRAEVEQPRTAYVFTGQGSQEPGMGMDLYASSPVARAIWDRADAHFRANYGFSILEIIRGNPKSLRVHFGGPKGAHIRKHYMSLVYETVAGDGRTVVGKRLFPEITEASLAYTFTSPAGLLAMTQFTQPAICLVEKVAFEVMRSRGLVCPSAAFAGHSLGEYAALASVGDVLGLETLCDVVFYRGMSMQVAVERDASGRSPYGMAAINPSRVQPGFTQDALRFVIGCVQRRLGLLLEIVNYNVQDWQYVVAGHLNAIECLTQTLNYINVSRYDCASLARAVASDPSALAQIEEGLGAAIDEARQKIDASLAKTGQALVVPQRGLASIPLPGIDVPFHSSFLLNGVAPFRAFLAKRIVPAFVEPVLLEGRYIPNLTARPFRLSRDYVQLVYDTCQSPVLKEVLAAGPSAFADPHESRVVATKLMIELLAYQFASPVRWIESQDVLFQSPLATERFVEIGPAPTLSGMAERTLKAKFEVMDDAMSYRRVILSHAKDKADIYYETGPGGDDEDDLGGAGKAPTPPMDAPQSAPQPSAPAITQQPAQSPAGGNTRPIDALPMEAADLLQIIVCTKMKKPPAQVPLAKSLKELSGGKSTLQNELMADLQKEFGGASVPERAEETSLQELAAALGKAPGFSKAPGKHVSSLISKMASSKFPAGFNASTAKAFLAAEFALSPAACDTIFAAA
jgi:fatty acid synthase subunit beta